MSNSAPSELPPLPLLSDSYFGEPLAILTIAQVFSLNNAQKQHFQSALKSSTLRPLRPGKQIYKYIEKHLEDFNYHADTLIATDTFNRNQGNCLSLAILTKALVDLTAVKISYELVETPIIYQSEGGMLLSSQHIRAVLTDPKASRSYRGLSLYQGKVIIDYFPTRGTRALRMVAEDEFYSMYYRNIAAEAMVNKNTNLAFWNLKKSLQLKPGDAHAINMMALLHSRLGYPGYAENLFLYSIEYGEESLELLNNYHALLIRLNRSEDARAIAIKLQQYDDPNPFKWIQLADIAYANNDYPSALTYYTKAANKADYLHQPYAGIARAQYKLGKPRAAHNAMKTALLNSSQPEVISSYQNKLVLFSKIFGKN
ncbi:MAG: hypothetical protein L3J22_03680 [Xanthomonadales bacterium]|nr:hypothetical protein [Xanthomonadales bacterium]